MSDSQSPMDVSCEPDTVSDLNDGMYVTYEYIGQLMRRAQHVTHCQTCTCDQ